MTRAPACLALLLAGASLASPAAAQDDSCLFEIRYVGGSGVRQETAGGINYFAGGGVLFACRGKQISMRADSVASYGGRTVQFIGAVRYRDSTVEMDADRGTYFKDGERWEARGNVVTKNLESGSTLLGPSLDYFRELQGTRPDPELYAVGRPTISYAVTDEAGHPAEPYLVVADRVRMIGNDRMWGGGRVTVDRSDFAARADSLRLDTGPAGEGTLLGEPVLRGLGTDSFALFGRRIDLALERRELSYVKALGEGRIESKDWTLVADTIGLDVTERKLEQTVAWGDSLRPHAVSADYEIRADSLALDTPGQRLTEARAFGTAWVGAAPDSVTQERNWLAGDSVVVGFAPPPGDTGGPARVRRIESRGAARSFYQLPSETGGRPALNYARGDLIRVIMLPGLDRVDRVEIRGQVDGLQLEPVARAEADTTRPPGGGRR